MTLGRPWQSGAPIAADALLWTAWRSVPLLPVSPVLSAPRPALGHTSVLSGSCLPSSHLLLYQALPNGCSFQWVSWCLLWGLGGPLGHGLGALVGLDQTHAPCCGDRSRMSQACLEAVFSRQLRSMFQLRLPKAHGVRACTRGGSCLRSACQEAVSVLCHPSGQSPAPGLSAVRQGRFPCAGPVSSWPHHCPPGFRNRCASEHTASC